MTIYQFIKRLESRGLTEDQICSAVADSVKLSKQIFEDAKTTDPAEIGFEFFVAVFDILNEQKELPAYLSSVAERISRIDEDVCDDPDYHYPAEKTLEDMKTLDGCYSIIGFLVDQIENLKKCI